MTEAAAFGVSKAERARLRRRYRKDQRFRLAGVAAILFAVSALVLLLVSIVTEAVSAFSRHELQVSLVVDPETADPRGERSPEDIRRNVAGFSGLVRAELIAHFPDAAVDVSTRRQLGRLVSTLAAEPLARAVASDPTLVGGSILTHVPVSDVTDLYLKGLVTDETLTAGAGPARVEVEGGRAVVEAPGGFGAGVELVRRSIMAERERHRTAAAAAAVSVERLSRFLEDRRAATGAVEAAEAGQMRASAREQAEAADPAAAGLARIAGVASAQGDMNTLRAALSDRLQAEAARAQEEAGALTRRAQKYEAQGRRAADRGEPIAETRRIQAEAAYLAADRRRVEADLHAARRDGLASKSPEDLLLEAGVALGRPLAPLAMLAAAEAPQARLSAALAVNSAEQAHARAVVAEQTARIVETERRIAALAAEGATVRAENLEAEALKAARSRLARLQRDASRLGDIGAELARLTLDGTGGFAWRAAAPAAAPPEAPEAPQPPAALDAPGAPQAPAGADASGPAIEAPAFLDRETAAQLGLDFGGAAALGFAAGRAEGGAPSADGELRGLMRARARAGEADVERDVERLARKQQRETAAADALDAALSDPASRLQLSDILPSVLVEVGGGVVKGEVLTPDRVEGPVLTPVAAGAADGAWRVRLVHTPEADRLFSDRQIVWTRTLEGAGEIVRTFNTELLTQADSTYPELAGLAAGLVGSMWLMLVTLLLSAPVGVLAAVYLEEFAPRNRWTDFIEVNINNLAAVPSIVFGLLGAAVFINLLGLPRSAPFVGGLVLSLMTLPTIIIATRASLRAVPPSIRQGALAIGASPAQTVFQHVLPLAAPGVLTGTIIGMAHALGETAPLLLIGMVAFVAEVPTDMFDSATALPVLIYKWASAPERAWQPMTSAAIIVLLLFMFAINALAVYLRRRLERRW